MNSNKTQKYNSNLYKIQWNDDLKNKRNNKRLLLKNSEKGKGVCSVIVGFYVIIYSDCKTALCC